MTLTFTRSGGFAGPAITIKGEVRFKGKVAQVLSDGGYERELSEQEASTLLEAAKQIPQIQEQQGAANNSPDQYQYDMQITWDDGRTQSVTLYGDSTGAHALLDWVRRECDLMWQHRIHQ